jgi:hypothetical protein
MRYTRERVITDGSPPKLAVEAAVGWTARRSPGP